MTPFLTAEWKNLINITYSIDPDLLISDLPKGLNLDLLNGKAHLSLVAFEFIDTRVKGFKVPFHINFPEVNLRYYVNCKGKRGVVFLREYVPRYCIALIADKLYNEPYQAIAMNCETQITANELRVRHTLQKEWKFLSAQQPICVLLAKGSTVKIFHPQKLERF